MSTAREISPEKRILQQLQSTEVQLLAHLAGSARSGDWATVDELFSTLSPLHSAVCKASGRSTRGDEREAMPACPAVVGQLLALSGLEKAVQKAQADALAELASLAHDGNWDAVLEALPIVELLNYARRRFQRS